MAVHTVKSFPHVRDGHFFCCFNDIQYTECIFEMFWNEDTNFLFNFPIKTLYAIQVSDFFNYFPLVDSVTKKGT